MVKSSARVDNEAVKYTGVRLRKWGKHVSEIRLPNSRERIWLGSYDTAEKAARAFDAAQFCLRGARAKFNFPNDPPSIAGGEALTPNEIRAVSQNYANSFRAGGSGSNQPLPPPPPPEEAEPQSPMSDSDTMDWSFLEALDSEQSRRHLGRVSDFQQFFYEPGDDMCMPLNFGGGGNDDNDSDDHAGGYSGNAHSFWNF